MHLFKGVGGFPNNNVAINVAQMCVQISSKLNQHNFSLINSSLIIYKIIQISKRDAAGRWMLAKSIIIHQMPT